MSTTTSTSNSTTVFAFKPTDDIMSTDMDVDDQQQKKLCFVWEQKRIQGPQDAPMGTIYYEESPEFFWRFLKPYYDSLPVINVLIQDYLGGHKFYNRCARRGLVRLFTTNSDSNPLAGGFLILPNPGYHDPMSLAIKQHRKGVLSAAEFKRISDDEERVAAADPLGEYLDFHTNGYCFVAWWIQPADIEEVSTVLELLQEEGEELQRLKLTKGTTENRVLADKMSLSKDEFAALLLTIDVPAKYSPTTSISNNNQPQSIKREKNNKSTRQVSHQTAPDDYILAPNGHPRSSDHYLHSLRALRREDLPLLKLLHDRVPNWLANVLDGQLPDPAQIGIHYPYVNHFSCLHIHFRTNVYPQSHTSNDRGLFPLAEIIRSLEADGGDVMKQATICGLLNPATRTWYHPIMEDYTSRAEAREQTATDGEPHIHESEDGTLHFDFLMKAL